MVVSCCSVQREGRGWKEREGGGGHQIREEFLD